MIREINPEDLNHFDLSLWRKKMEEETGTVDYNSLPDDLNIYYPINWASVADRDLDNYSIGIYSRLALLERFSHPLDEIYSYGIKENVEKAMEKLERFGYLQRNAQGNLQVAYIA